MYPNGDFLQYEDSPELIDTHCHLDCEPLSSRIPGVLENARQTGVTRFVVPGVDPAGWRRIETLAHSEHGVHPAYGIHPMHAALADADALATLASLAPHGVAIGEIGLDGHCVVPMAVQEQAFREQLRLAVRLALPVLIHCRRAFEPTLRILREERASRVGGIMHAFSGSTEMAREFIRLGFVISLCGTVTWENAVRPVRLAAALPLQHMVLETDSPDLAPQPRRGEYNEPARMAETLFAVARIRGMLVADLAAAVGANTSRILGKLGF